MPENINENSIITTLPAEAAALLQDFMHYAAPAPKSLWVIGCSTSEILGKHIGKGGSEEVGRILASAILSAAAQKGIYAAVQCCEHLNRSLVVERAVAIERNLEIVSAIPKPHAGGSLAAAFWLQLSDPVLVSTVQADCGLDIGQTLIGMHIKRVAVPLRLPTPRLGQAMVTAATSRPPLIGGERAQYR